jgi:hypothetical protein
LRRSAARCDDGEDEGQRCKIFLLEQQRRRCCNCRRRTRGAARAGSEAECFCRRDQWTFLYGREWAGEPKGISSSPTHLRVQICPFGSAHGHGNGGSPVRSGGVPNGATHYRKKLQPGWPTRVLLAHLPGALDEHPSPVPPRSPTPRPSSRPAAAFALVRRREEPAPPPGGARTAAMAMIYPPPQASA